MYIKYLLIGFSFVIAGCASVSVEKRMNIEVSVVQTVYDYMQVKGGPDVENERVVSTITKPIELAGKRVIISRVRGQELIPSKYFVPGTHLGFSVARSVIDSGTDLTEADLADVNVIQVGNPETKP